MSRSGYSEDAYDDQWRHICWRGAVAASIRGKRGQAFLRELLETLDAMSEKALYPNSFESGDKVCALGSVGQRRGVDMSSFKPEYEDDEWPTDFIASTFGVADAFVREIMFMNDEAFDDWRYQGEVARAHARWRFVRRWVDKNIKATA